MHKVLVVDDDIDLLEMITAFLRTKSFIVQAISRWEDVLSSIKTFNPDLILMDITLKGADGRVICRRLKTSAQTKDIPVLLFSGNYNVRLTLPESLADGFIEKPFDPMSLIEKIHAMVSGNANISS